MKCETEDHSVLVLFSLKMYSKLIPLLLVLCVTFCFGRKSFSVLLDTTQSMQEEIDVIKSNIGAVLNVVDVNDVENYILLPFKDPEVGPVYNLSSATGMISHLNKLTVSGGQDCPENTLAAIQRALEVSNPESYIFVFTDAYAKDNSKLSDVQKLCADTKSKVIIILSGSCVSTNTRTSDGNTDVYFDVARACAGGIFQFDPMTLRQAFTLMKQFIQTDWNEVNTYDASKDYKDITFSVDPSTVDVVIAVYGNHPKLYVYGQNGRLTEVDKIVDTTHTLVVGLKDLHSGNYRLRTRSHTTIYKRNDVPLQVGFSLKPTKTLKLTSSNPLSVDYFGTINYILLLLPPDSTIKLKSLNIYKFNTNETTTHELEEDGEYEKLYTTSEYFSKDTSFQITVSGQDTATYENFIKSTKVMKTQQISGVEAKQVSQAKPVVEIIPPKTTLLDYGSDITLACKVIGYPKPDITWTSENEDNISFQVEDFIIEIPDTFVSYATINNIKKNCTVFCKAKNSEGAHTQSQDLFVEITVTFEVKQTPQDETIEYGSEIRLHCEIEANPEVTIQWFHNDSLLSFSENINFEFRNQILVIKNMSLENTGEYKCEAKNEFETRNFTAVVNISGLEAPQTELKQTEINLKPEEKTEVECIVKGKPTPEITWKYLSDETNGSWQDVPDGVNLEGRILKIPSLKIEHSGLYRCEAFNVIGQDFSDLKVKIQYAPIVKIKQDTLTVREGDLVQLECDVDAIPVARVYWEMYQKNVIVPFVNRHSTDAHYTHRFEAYSEDNGIYKCIAENDLGMVEQTIKVNVIVPPYIEPPQIQNITTKTGASLSLLCNVLYGNPVPTTTWEFISLSSTRNVILSGTGTVALRLNNISKSQEGSYICIAENEEGSDNIKYYVTLQ